MFQFIRYISSGPSSVLQHRQSLFQKSFLQIYPLYFSKLCFNKCNGDFNPSWACSSCNLASVAISAARSLSGSSSLWQSSVVWMEGGRKRTDWLFCQRLCKEACSHSGCDLCWRRSLYFPWVTTSRQVEALLGGRIVLATTPNWTTTTILSVTSWKGLVEKPVSSTQTQTVVEEGLGQHSVNPPADTILWPHIIGFNQLSFKREEISVVFLCFFQSFNVLNSLWWSVARRGTGWDALGAMGLRCWPWIAWTAWPGTFVACHLSFPSIFCRLYFVNSIINV